ncbi:MAG: tetratricopeptide repeat protein, partial [Deltaproteobacteria bacterium]|nr:tetratricopeptide repeat protein [Deltaproteobacteria bacterium]
MEAARKYRDKGQKDKAIKEYLKVVREDPKDVRVWLKIGDLYAQKGAKQEATETYQKVAKFYSEQGFYLKAVAVYKQILKLDPRTVEVNLKLAELYRQLGLISDAMAHFEKVAGFFHREGKTKEALATIRQLVDLDPENVATRIKLAELYSKEEMVEDAVAEFQHACDFLKRNNREDDYVKVAERLLWHAPERVDLARELAAMYLRRRDPRRALQKLQACFKADQRDVETLALLAQAFQALDQKGKTVSVLKELARVLTENGQRTQAEEVHRKILAYVPDDADSLAAVGKPPTLETPQPRPRQDRLNSIAEGAEMKPPVAKPTGSMPIMEEQEDLASDLSLDDEPQLADGSSASAEVHADEIVKILTETDVYVKYGLHQKAVHHLRRVFELDPSNIEARERLK